MEFSVSSYLSLPHEAGVYRFLDKEKNVLYVGKANDLKNRVSSYFTLGEILGEKTRLFVDQIKRIKITVVESELEALLLEAFYIKKYRPKYNVKLADNKSYIKIKINLTEKYPTITLARKTPPFWSIKSKALFFGPYPSISSVRLVLKTLRRAFPYVSVINHPKRICLYNHLGLCPCPPVFDSVELRKNYMKNIRNIIRILEGQSRKIMIELEKERGTFSKREQFEEALRIQKKINALSVITTPFHQPFEYVTNPNLRTDIRRKELNELMNVLNPLSGCDLKKLERIECYDISNLQGSHASGSMVVFINGEKESSMYRRFRIHKNEKPDDFAMLAEMLRRRFKHREWNFPDLIIVDGGKGQVSAALKILRENNLNIPLIGLAKRDETIVIPIFNFKEVSLPKNSPALHLIMRIRDEAHRFAISYHKKLRSKSAIFS